MNKQVMKKYRKKTIQSMRPYVLGEDLSGVSVSKEDAPEEGGMIAVGADNGAMWYISKSFFELNYLVYVNDEEELMRKFRKMCQESLDPETYEMSEQVERNLRLVRSKLK